jgi:hypothetical protein
MGDEQYGRIFGENARAIVTAHAPGGWRLVGFDVLRDADDEVTIRSQWAWGGVVDQRRMTIESRSPREGDALDGVVEQLRRWDPLA